MDGDEGWPPFWGALGDLCVFVTFGLAFVLVALVLRDALQPPGYVFPMLAVIGLGGVRWIFLMAKLYWKP